MGAGEFWTAREAREAAVLRGPIIAEVALIQAKLSTAITAGQLEVVVGPASSPAVTTGMTVDTAFYLAWSDAVNHQTAADRTARMQMDEVVGYFTRKGYSITRSQHGSGNTWNWTLKW